MRTTKYQPTSLQLWNKKLLISCGLILFLVLITILNVCVLYAIGTILDTFENEKEKISQFFHQEAKKVVDEYLSSLKKFSSNQFINCTQLHKIAHNCHKEQIFMIKTRLNT